MPGPTERFDDPSEARGRAEVLLAVVNETRALFHALKVAAQGTLGDDGVTAGQRGVLMDLARHGPLTVPELARMRPVSRQHIQEQVNPMLEDGLVALTDNPAHKRSKLVKLTADGNRLARALSARERRRLASLELDVSDAELRRTAVSLRRLREALGERET